MDIKDKVSRLLIPGYSADESRLGKLWRRPKLGLALGGGGARGLAHIGVLRVLQREGIHIDAISGTSMGGLVGAAWASGWGIDRLQNEALRLASWRYLARLFDLNMITHSMLAGRRIRAFFEERFEKRDFNELPIPLAVVAADLITGKEVVLHEGPLLDAAMATMCLPGIFPPVRYRDWLLIDGGVVNNLPVDTVRTLGADVVLAVDVSSTTGEFLGEEWCEGGDVSEYPSVLQVLQTAAGITQYHLTREQLNHSRPEIMIRPQMGNELHIFSFKEASRIVTLGEEAAEAALPELRQVLQPRLALF